MSNVDSSPTTYSKNTIVGSNCICNMCVVPSISRDTVWSQFPFTGANNKTLYIRGDAYCITTIPYMKKY